MKVRVIKNLGNSFYDRYIDQEFEATKSVKDVYTILGIPTKILVRVKDKLGKPGGLVGTQWFPNEVKVK